ncbi:MAG TPA: ABC transporter ATP-binding protein, partial [Anaerolineaceae bacterium]|nr:ABC transporter ATP-binding protein [Anaerolineaceae bacterium]
VAQRIEKNVRNELYTSLLGKSMTFHNLQPVGDTMARATNDVREVNFMFSPGFNMVIGSLNFLIMPLILAPTYHPSLLITPIVFIIVFFIAIRRYMNILRPITDQVRQSFGLLNTRLSEVLDGIEIVKSSSQERAEIGRFNQQAEKYQTAIVRQGDEEAKFLPYLLLSVALAAGLLHALLLFRAGAIDAGDVIAYFGLLLMLDFPTFSGIFAYSRISLGLAGARRILELMNQENNLDQNADGYSESMRGEVEFRNVCFTYLPDKEGDDCDRSVLQNISVKVQPGQTVAIVGQTGTGKTTLVRLINRTYDVTGGTVFVDGVDVREWDLEALRRNISIIEQDIFLFSRTIAENIAFGKPSATREEIESAARAAQAHDFILKFKDGYETVVGERGVTLSGGQRQRIALARAFLTDPRILVLDDSTSAIDSQTEDHIQRAIYAAARGRTTFIITHRLSQIRWADVILVMRGGELVASGTHEQLMETSDAYRRIFSE